MRTSLGGRLRLKLGRDESRVGGLASIGERGLQGQSERTKQAVWVGSASGKYYSLLARGRRQTCSHLPEKRAKVLPKILSPQASDNTETLRSIPPSKEIYLGLL